MKGITVYMREYQHHSNEAEAAWRVQDEKHTKEDEESGESEDKRTERSEDKGGKQEVPGEALWREIREGTVEMDKEIQEQEKEEDEERRRTKTDKTEGGSKRERDASLSRKEKANLQEGGNNKMERKVQVQTSRA